MAERFFAREAQQLRLHAGRLFRGEGILAARAVSCRFVAFGMAARAGIGAQGSLHGFALRTEAARTPPATLWPSPPVPPQPVGYAACDARKTVAFFLNESIAA